MYRIIKIVEQGGKKADRMLVISGLAYTKLQEARSKLLPVHDVDLKRWGLREAKAINLHHFKGSKHWISNFKRTFRMSYRRVTRVTTRKLTSDLISTVASAMEFRDEFEALVPQFTEKQIFNTDQSGFEYELHATRTFSHTGEKVTSLNVDSRNSTTHSYSIQPILGHKLFICLQETAGRVGPLVEASYHRAPNLGVTCSSSGKLHKSHIRRRVELALFPQFDSKCLLVSDSWSGQKDDELYADLPLGKTCVRLQIPPSTTCIVQPLDVYYFRQWKAVAKAFYDHVQLEELPINMYQRDHMLKLQSLIHNQLSSEKFVDMGLYAWFAAGLRLDQTARFLTPSVTLFPREIGVHTCSAASCVRCVFIRCSHCNEFFCFRHFFEEDHAHF